MVRMSIHYHILHSSIKKEIRTENENNVLISSHLFIKCKRKQKTYEKV